MSKTMSRNLPTNISVLQSLSIALDANRKKGNMEKDLDAMLFGGSAPVRRRQPAEQAKPTEQSKPTEQPKPADPKPQPSSNVPIVPSNQQKPGPVNPPSDPNKNKPVNPSTDVNKSTDSGKNVNPNQGGTGGTITISGGKQVVVPPPNKNIITNKQK